MGVCHSLSIQVRFMVQNHLTTNMTMGQQKHEKVNNAATGNIGITHLNHNFTQLQIYEQKVPMPAGRFLPTYPPSTLQRVAREQNHFSHIVKPLDGIQRLSIT